MTNATNYKFETHDGWPPDGEPGDFYGFDADHTPCLLRWSAEKKWIGVRFSGRHFAFGDGNMPEAFVRGAGTEQYVRRWARAPLRYSALGQLAASPTPTSAGE